MSQSKPVKYYPPLEEKINIISHGIGFVLGAIALILMVRQAYLFGDTAQMIGACVFGISLMILYAASTAYHSAKEPELRSKLRIFDHASIYILLAGSYTPFTLVTLKGELGWIIFGIVWSLAIVGVCLKIFFTGRYSLLSTIMYVLMGWMVVFVMKPLMNSLPSEGLYWLLAGGVAYTVGAILYSIKNMKFNHAIFHIFVLVGSFCHFMAVYFYVLR